MKNVINKEDTVLVNFDFEVDQSEKMVKGILEDNYDDVLDYSDLMEVERKRNGFESMASSLEQSMAVISKNTPALLGFSPAHDMQKVLGGDKSGGEVTQPREADRGLKAGVQAFLNLYGSYSPQLAALLRR